MNTNNIGAVSNKKKNLDELFSLLTDRFGLIESKVNLAEKYYKYASVDEIVEDIMKNSEKVWEHKSQVYKRKKDMQKAAMRVILRHAREDFALQFQNNLNKIQSFERESANMDIWFTAVEEGFVYLASHMPKVMTKLTYYPWEDKELVIREGANKQTFLVTVPSGQYQEDFFDKEYDYEDVIVSKDSQSVSLQNFLAKQIEDKKLIIRGTPKVIAMDRNTIKLHPNYVDSLPCLSLPITCEDIDRLKILAQKFDSAEEMLDKLNMFDAKNDGNRYFELYPELKNSLLHIVLGIKREIEDENKREDCFDCGVDYSKSNEFRKSEQTGKEALEERLADFKQSKLPDVEIYLDK